MSFLGDFSQLPLNVALNASPDTVQNAMPTGPTPAPVFPAPFGPQAALPSAAYGPLPDSSQPQYPSQSNPYSSQPQYLTDLTRMFGVLTENQVAFQQGIMRILGQPQVAHDAPRLGSSVKVRNPRMFSGKHEEVTPFLSEVNRIIQFNAVSFPSDNHKVLFLALYLKDGIPVEWFNHLESHASPLLHNWPRFLAEFRTKFADPRLIQTAEYKLDQLVQTGSAHSYLTHFIELSSHLDMTEQTKISRFMKGLKPAIKDNLVSIINRPQTLQGWKNIIIQVDANISHREIEKQEESKSPKHFLEPFPPVSSVPSDILPITQPSLEPPPPITASDVVPMEVDVIRDYRIKNNLCLSCGKHVQGKVNPEEN